MIKRYSLLILFTQILVFSCNSPGIKDNIQLSELTVSEIHKAYRSGRFTPVQLVEAYLDRIEKNDSLLNAITFINYDAIEIATLLDKEFRETGELRPLHGIPLLVKDNINTAGMPTTAGSLALENYVPGENAFIIQRLLEAGAIIIGKTNMAEWAFSPMHTESSTAGITHNPYDTDYVPAGSSGGTAAAVAANFGTVGLGTDTGNSIRGPSSHCALVGFRTTLGLVSRSAIVPLYLRNDVVGPMCRTVEDATRVLDVIAGYDPDDPITMHSKGEIPETYLSYLDKDGLEGARIGVLDILSYNKSDPEIQVLFKQAVNDMRSLGAEVIDSVDIPGFAGLSRNQWCPVFREDVESFLAEYVKSDTIQSIEDIIKAGSRSEYAREGLKSFAENSDEQSNCLDAYNDPRRIAFRQAIESVMDSLRLDALIYPTWNYKPARIDHFQEEYKGDNSQIIAPHTGQPAFTVPMGYTGDNLPAGLQFLGRMFSEPALISLVYSYEQGTLHREAPNL